MQWRFHWLHFLEPRYTYDHADTRGNNADRAHLNEFGLPGSSVAGIRRGAEVKARQDSDLNSGNASVLGTCSSSLLLQAWPGRRLGGCPR